MRNIIESVVTMLLVISPTISHAIDTSISKYFNTEISYTRGYDEDVSTPDNPISNERLSDDFGLIELGLEIDLGKSGYLAYDYEQTHYDSLGTNDNDAHSISFGTSFESSNLDLGIDIAYTNMSLDSEDFMELITVGPSGSFSAGNAVYSISTQWTKKELETVDTLDGDNYSVGVSSLFFSEDFRSYLNLSLIYEFEDARASDNDFRGAMLTFSGKRPAPLFGFDSFLGASVSYRDREYYKVSDILTRNKNDQLKFIFYHQTYFKKNVYGRLEYEYKELKTNQVDSTYDAHKIEYKFTISF